SLSNSQQLQLFPQADVQFQFNFYLTDRYLPFMHGQSRTTFIVPELRDAVTFTAIVDDDHLLFNFTWSDRVFADARFVERLLFLSQQILAGKRQLATLSLQLPDELPATAPLTAGHAPDYPVSSVLALIEQQAEQTPAAIAVADSRQQLSYQQLNQVANRLAHYLLKQGVKPGDRLAICHDSEAGFLVALLATLKCAACYVPVDAAYPPERIRHIVSDCNARLLLSQHCLLDRLDGLHEQIIAIDDINSELAALPDHNPGIYPQLDDALYAIYTSGSTGLPKGALVTQRGELNLVQWYLREFAFSRDDRVLIISATGFDLTQKNLLAPLCCGAQVVFAGSSYDPGVIIDAIAQQAISLVNCAPSAFYPLLDDSRRWPQLASLRLVLFGGEPIRISAMQDWLQSDSCQARLVNMYGPTECTDIATFYCIDDVAQFADQPVPIGKASDHVVLAVADPSLRLLPPGMTGELLIGGEGVGLGYIGLEQLTEEKFIHHPQLGRVYRSGDLVVQLADGNYRFVGRIDHQLKLRGLRIEAGEIEYALRQLDDVGDALVQVIDERLLAWVLTGDGTTPEQWRATLARQLPDYMLPQALVAVKQWPLTANGKIDRKALPLPDDKAKTAIAPRNATEEKLAAIWRDVLGIEQVSVDAGFFELGGHSLLAARAVAHIREQFGQDLPLRELFLNPTIAAIAALLEQGERASQLPPLLPAPRTEDNRYPLSFAQQRLWFIESLQPGTAVYNMPFALRIRGPLDSAALQQAFTQLQQRHEVLRSRIVSNKGQVWQQPAPEPLAELPLLPFAGDAAALQLQAADFLSQPFDLGRDALIRGQLLQLADNDTALLLCLHHIIADGGTLDILLRDMLALYQAAQTGSPALLPALELQYVDYSLWQRHWLSGTTLDRQVNYWREQLAGLETLNLPCDYLRPARLDHHGSQYHFSLDKSLSETVRAFCRSQDITLFMLLIGCFRLLLGKYSGQQDIAIGTPVANRPLPALDNMAGLFVNTLVIRSYSDDGESVQDFLQQLKHTCLDAFNHQDVPFELLVEALNVPRDLSQTPLFQAMFVMQSAASSQPAALGGLELLPLADSQPHTTAKFDLTLNLIDDTQLAGVMEYRTALFSEQTIARMADHFVRLLQAIVAAPAQPLSSLQFISPAEIDRLQAFNNTAFDYPPCDALHRLIEQQAAATPAAIAVCDAQQSLSYDELNAAANRLA
ncbi:MAG TPA: amino acid adenylation domain-containing protein, partial [Pseudomonadales bacterium]